MTVEIRTCIHIKPNGVQCGSPALRGKTLCYYHIKPRQARRSISLEIPDLHEPSAVTYVVNQIMVGLVRGTMATKQASAMLYALQIAQKEKSG
ncbi:MAG: hypothetical protein JWO13_1554 [Acidobacteriales bacterium]|nr:hypothetical protein [Terriglobales bacterium]